MKFSLIAKNDFSSHLFNFLPFTSFKKLIYFHFF